jgi:hypothetical protein
MAYTRSWDETKPNGATTAANTLDTEIHHARVDLRERITALFAMSSADFSADPVVPRAIALTHGTITTDVNTISATVTWNNAAVTFTALEIDVTSTASAAASKLIDLQVAGVSQFSVTKAGAVAVAGALAITGAFTGATTGAFSSNVTVGGTLGVTGVATFTVSPVFTAGIANVAVTSGLTLTGATITGQPTWASTQNMNIIGNVTGNVSGSSGSTTGNAATATALQTGRAINGVTFDGTAAITVTAAAGTLTGATLNATVTASSLTSVGTLTSLTSSGTIRSTIAGGSEAFVMAAGARFYLDGPGGNAFIRENSAVVEVLTGGNTKLQVTSTVTLTSNVTGGLVVTTGGITVSAGTTAVQALTASGLASFSNTGGPYQAILNVTPTNNPQIGLANGSVAGIIGHAYSSGYTVLTNNANQGTHATDSWSQSTAGFKSIKLELGYSSTALALYQANAGTATANNATFWGSAVFSVTPAGAGIFAAGITATTLTLSSTAQLGGRLYFGGTTSSHTAIDRSGTTIQMLLGDGSAYTAVQMASLTATSVTSSSTILLSTNATSLAGKTTGAVTKSIIKISASDKVLIDEDALGAVFGAGLTATTGTFSGAGTFGGNLVTNSSFVIGWSGASTLLSPSDGVIRLANSAATDFSRLQFGGTTSSFPAFARSSATLQAVKADGSAYTNFEAAVLYGDSGLKAGSGGATVTKWLTATVSFNPGSTISPGTASTTVTVTGAAVGDLVVVSGAEFHKQGGSHTATHIAAYVSAADTVTVIYYNFSGATLDPTAETIRVFVCKF